jgi:hypothetical protein
MPGEIVLSSEFNCALGYFHTAWLFAELTVDYLIGHFLNIPAEETHHLVAGMEIGRKLRLLESLLHRSDHKNKATLIGYLRKIQNESKRNVLAHSLLLSSNETITFVNRSFGQKYEAKLHTFTLETFTSHVKEFLKNGQQFYKSACIEDTAIQAFGHAAISAVSNLKTSPVPPSSSA